MIQIYYLKQGERYLGDSIIMREMSIDDYAIQKILR